MESYILPAELWDLILGFLPIKILILTRPISLFYSDSIRLNKRFKRNVLTHKYEALAGENNLKELPINIQFEWAVTEGYLDIADYLYPIIKKYCNH